MLLHFTLKPFQTELLGNVLQKCCVSENFQFAFKIKHRWLPKTSDRKSHTVTSKEVDIAKF